jgi:hypothetical protein
MQPTSFDAGMRPFGHAADLDLDLRSSDRPQLVTALLAQCAGTDDPALWWSRSVGARIAALLRLIVLTEARDEIEMSARCAAPECGEVFAFALPLRVLADTQSEDGEPIAVTLGPARVVSIRRPSGDDLRRLRDARPSSREAAVRAMLDAIVLDGTFRDEDAPAVAAALAENDPLVDFALACRCPACGSQTEVTVDLEALALRRLHARQANLLGEVHRLASRYGWTEAEVLALPAWRRAHYLALIDEEER